MWFLLSLLKNRLPVESICDRIAACKTYNKDNYRDSDALQYYLTKPDSKYMHPETAASMERILRMVAEQGEEKTFAYIKACNLLRKAPTFQAMRKYLFFHSRDAKNAEYNPSAHAQSVPRKIKHIRPAIKRQA
jgi:hypothetical protein